MKRVAIGVRMHSGWGALVAVAMNARDIEVIERRRITVVDRGMRGAVQPYHFAENMNLSEAQKHLKACAAASERLTLTALRDVIEQLERRAHRVVGCGLLMAAGRPLPSLSGILASHALIHTAEGEFFRNAVRCACDRLRVRVNGYRERDLTALARAAFGKTAARIERSMAKMGRALGPPWTTDQKAAALAACLVLAKTKSGS